MSWVRSPSHAHEVALASKLGIGLVRQRSDSIVPWPALGKAGVFGVGFGFALLVVAVHRRRSKPSSDVGTGEALELEQKVGLAGLALMASGVCLLCFAE